MRKRNQKSNPPSALIYASRNVTAARKRRLVALFCRMLGDELLNPKPSNESPLPGDSSSPPVVAQSLASSLSGPPLPPRQLQTLELLLMGLSEKEIAGHLKISRHTVHVYVKALYKRFNVTSKGELLAKWVRK